MNSPIYIIVERAIRECAQRGGNGYDELARAVVQALDRNSIHHPQDIADQEAANADNMRVSP